MPKSESTTVDPLKSTSRALAPEIVGQEHCNAARGVQKVLQRLKDLRDNIAILYLDEDDACDMILRDSGK